jgi:hypothetical protein
MQSDSPPPDKFREGAKAYRNGFLIGAFIGIVICLVIKKTLWSVPILLGLLGGAIAINRKI